MRNIRKKFGAIFLCIIIAICSCQNISSVFAAEDTTLTTGYVDIPSWISTRELNVRSSPSSSATKIGSLKNGSSVKILDSVAKITKVDNKNVVTDPWYKISYSTNFGYVSAD